MLGDRARLSAALINGLSGKPRRPQGGADPGANLAVLLLPIITINMNDWPARTDPEEAAIGDQAATARRLVAASRGARPDRFPTEMTATTARRCTDTVSAPVGPVGARPPAPQLTAVAEPPPLAAPGRGFTPPRLARPASASTIADVLRQRREHHRAEPHPGTRPRAPMLAPPRDLPRPASRRAARDRQPLRWRGAAPVDTLSYHSCLTPPTPQRRNTIGPS